MMYFEFHPWKNRALVPPNNVSFSLAAREAARRDGGEIKCAPFMIDGVSSARFAPCNFAHQGLAPRDITQGGLPICVKKGYTGGFFWLFLLLIS